MAPDAPKNIVGRGTELAIVANALDNASTGHGQVVLIGGEPGIGKSRLLAEAKRIAQDRHACLVSVRNYENIGAPAYWPWIQALKPFAAESGVPEVLNDLQGDAQADPDRDPSVARFDLFDRVTSLFKSFSNRGPVVLTLDDLQWADTSSLRLLQFFGGELADSKIVAIATFRDNPKGGSNPLARTLADLNRESHCTRITLRGLEGDQIATLINQHTGNSPSTTDVNVVANRTSGNPFFVEEIAQGMAQGKSASGLSAGLRDAIMDRIERMSDSCQELLKSASVIGTEFSTTLLGAIESSHTLESLLDQLDTAVASDLVVRTEPPGRFRFKHDLVRDAIFREIPEARRTRLHLNIAQELELNSAPMADVAYHYKMARPIVGPRKSIEFATMAARQALSVHAFEDAIEHFQTALEVIAEDDACTEAAELWFGLSMAQARVYGRLEQQQTVDTRTKAFSMMLELGDKTRAVEIATAYFPLAYHGPIGLAPMLETALELAEPGSEIHCELLSAFGQRVSIEMGEFDRALESYETALQIAIERNDARLELLTRTRMLSVYAHFEQYEALQQNLIKARSLIGLADVPEAEAEIYTFVSQRKRGAEGDAEGSFRYAQRALNAARRSRGQFELITALTNLTRLTVAGGHWREAREYINQGLTIDPTERNILQEAVILEASLGQFEAARQYAQTLIELATTTQLPNHASATVEAIVGFNFLSRSGFGPDVLTQVSNLCLKDSNTESLTEYRGLQAAAHSALLQGDEGRLLEIWNRVEPRWAGQSRCYFLWKLGRLEEAEKAFEEYLERLNASKMRPLSARVSLQFAELLIDRERPGDQEKAERLIDQALVDASDLGMVPIVERLTEQAARLHESGISQHGLSPRELEVLRLIVLGRSNQQIADELYISRHTVNNHVAHILQKLNVRNRVEAVTFAIDNRLNLQAEDSE